MPGMIHAPSLASQQYKALSLFLRDIKVACQSDRRRICTQECLMLKLVFILLHHFFMCKEAKWELSLSIKRVFPGAVSPLILPLPQFCAVRMLTYL